MKTRLKDVHSLRNTPAKVTLCLILFIMPVQSLLNSQLSHCAKQSSKTSKTECVASGACIFSIKRLGRLFKTRPYRSGVYFNPAFIRCPAFIKHGNFLSFLTAPFFADFKLTELKA